MQKPKIKLVITDLDNTLYDWFLPWYKSFSIFIDDVLNETEIDEKVLLQQIQKIHQKYGTSEYSFDFLLNELEIFKENYPSEKVDQLRHKFYKTKKTYLKLYPGVLETLINLKQTGCKIVAYTESMEFYAKDRIRKLGLDGILDQLYSPEDHDVPKDFQRYYDEDYYTLKKTEYFKLPLRHKKPDRYIIDEIKKHFSFKNNEIVYVGDSLTKDIIMAQHANIYDIYAKYGTSHQRKEYELLKKVTHWTDDEVQKEKNTTSRDIVPTYTLKASFCEIFDYFDFGINANSNPINIENIIKMWDRTIDVQKHFNDIAFKIKQLVVSISSFIVGGGFALISAGKINKVVKYNNLEISTISILLFITAFIWIVFYFVDRFWYHPLLKGAVKEGVALENEISNYLPIKGLTKTIGEYSPIVLPVFGVIHSEAKMNIFYWSIILILLITACYVL